MPCNGDYLKANESEKNLSVIYGLLDELETGKIPEKFGTGYDRRVYGRGLSKAHLDEKTDELCSKLHELDVSKNSLEMQMWWRDHKEADKKRLENELNIQKDTKAKEIALGKLLDWRNKMIAELRKEQHEK